MAGQSSIIICPPVQAARFRQLSRQSPVRTATRCLARVVQAVVKQSAASAAGTRARKGSGDGQERAGHGTDRARLARGRDRRGSRGGGGGNGSHARTGRQRTRDAARGG